MNSSAPMSRTGEALGLSPDAVSELADAEGDVSRASAALAAECTNGRMVLRPGTPQDRDQIYQIRHEVYAEELQQHQAHPDGLLKDSLDDINEYLVVESAGTIVGFVSITPPGHDRYSIDKYFQRDELPFEVNDRLYEVRLLTVPSSARRWFLALALMYASFRYVEARGGTRIMAIGRREVLSMYHRVGLKDLGLVVQAGAVHYHLMQTTIPEVHAALPGIRKMLDRIDRDIDWQLGIPYNTPSPCYHGGEFFDAIGDQFDRLERRQAVINADVLDAWFDPCPGALESLSEHLPWLLKTSPPTGCEGLIRTIAETRGVGQAQVLPGAGSSDLIFLAFCQWLTRDSRVLMLTPSYGEYRHVLEKVVGCRVVSFRVDRDANYTVNLQRLAKELKQGYDLVVLVNPNNPTGQLIPRRELEDVLSQTPSRTRVWIDEAYLDYVGAHQSVERFAARSENVIVCKSMSKVYGLSGARVAYLCANTHQLESLRSITPPWVVSLPAQLAAVRALQDPDYYAERYRETAELRRELQTELEALGWEVVPSVANFLLCHLPTTGPDAATLVQRCRQRDLFIRNTATIDPQLQHHTVRLAVKDRVTNKRMLGILREICG